MKPLRKLYYGLPCSVCKAQTILIKFEQLFLTYIFVCERCGRSSTMDLDEFSKFNMENPQNETG